MEFGFLIEESFGGQEAFQFLGAGPPVGAQGDHIAGQCGHEGRIVVGTGHQGDFFKCPQVAGHPHLQRVEHRLRRVRVGHRLRGDARSTAAVAALLALGLHNKIG